MTGVRVRPISSLIAWAYSGRNWNGAGTAASGQMTRSGRPISTALSVWASMPPTIRALSLSTHFSRKPMLGWISATVPAVRTGRVRIRQAP